jgi:hypothetical protein
MCEHDTTCPTADAVDHDAAVVVAHDDTTGYSKLCNGVIRFDDGGEILPDGTITGPCRGPALHAAITEEMDSKLEIARLRVELEKVQFDLRMAGHDARMAVIDARMEALIRSTSDAALKAQIELILAQQKRSHTSVVLDHAPLILWLVWWVGFIVLCITTT